MTSDVAYLWRLRGHMTGSIHWDPALCTFDSTVSAILKIH